MMPILVKSDDVTSETKATLVTAGTGVNGLTRSIFHVAKFLITCNETFTCRHSSCIKELIEIFSFYEFENDEGVIETSS